MLVSLARHLNIRMPTFMLDYETTTPLASLNSLQPNIVDRPTLLPHLFNTLRLNDHGNRYWIMDT